jgi:uncharacterized protein (DUF433 family)
MVGLTHVGSLIAQTPGICGGRPRLAGTGVSIRRIVGWRKMGGLSCEEIADQYAHVNLAQVHAALAFYHANRDQIEAELAEEAAEYERLEALHRTGRWGAS